MKFLNSESFEKVNLNYVQTAEFETDWLKNIIPDIIRVMALIASSPSVAAVEAATTAILALSQTELYKALVKKNE